MLQRHGLVGVSALKGPVVEIGVDHARVGVVVLPGVAAVGQLLKDRLLGNRVHVGVEVFII